MKPILFDGAQRTASSFYYFAERNIPGNNKKLYYQPDFESWAKEVRIAVYVETRTRLTNSDFVRFTHIQNVDMPRALLLSKPKGVPILWRVLANKYKDKIVFASHKDWSSKTSKKMGLPVGGKKDSKVLVYPVGSIEPVLFEGTPLSHYCLHALETYRPPCSLSLLWSCASSV